MDEIKKLKQAVSNLEDQASRQNREMTGTEKNLRSEILQQIHDLEMSLPEKALTMPGPIGSGFMGGGRTSRGGATDNGGFENIGEIMSALYRKSKGEGFDERLRPLQIKAAAQIGETVPSEGGFMIPTQFVERALNEDLMDTVILQLCDRQLMTVNDMTVPAFQDDDHSATHPFGITWGQIAEGASFGTTQGTPFRSLNLSAKKSGALFLVNNEWLADSSTGVRQRLENIWKASLRWYIEDLLWAGTGAGQPLGALNSDGAVSIPIESGQANNTIVVENIVNMWARLRPGSHSRAVWACNATVFPSLATLSLAVGTGGAPVGILQTNASIAGSPATSIFGRPLHLNEHLPSIGNSGDLVLLDPLLYLLGDRQQITLDASPHLKFDYDQTVFRASARIDAQPIYNSPLTPKNGATCGWLVKVDDRI
jgi:HK97 family phage major capsid protein